MTDAPHSWQRGDEAWCRYFDLKTDGYVPRLEGKVVGVGKAGVTVRLLKPDREGKLTARIAFHDVWPSEEAIKAAIALNPSPTRPRAPGT